MDIKSPQPIARTEGEARTPQMRAVLCAALADSAGSLQRNDAALGNDSTRRHRQIARDLLQRYNGEELAGDGAFLALFGRALDAVAFSLDLQRRLASDSCESARSPQARIGVHVGELVAWRTAPGGVAPGAGPVEVEGLARPVAARLMALAQPGQILLSGAAFNLAQRASIELADCESAPRWITHGRYRFRGVPLPQLVHEVGEPGIAALRAPESNDDAWRDTPLWRRPMALAIEAIAAVAVLGIALLVLMRPVAVIAFAERDWVVLGDLQNHTSDERLSGALDAGLRIGLEQSRFVNVLPSAQVREALGRMQRGDARVDREAGMEIAQREGARALILPSLSNVGGRLRLSLELVDPRSGATVLVENAVANGQEQLLPEVDRALAALRSSLGEALKDIELSSMPLEQITTRNLEALREFGSAVAAMGERRMDVAQTHLERALQLDPQFAMAHAHTGLLRIAMQSDSAAGQASLQRAADLSDRLSRREQLAINAAQHHYADADETLERVMALAKEYPDHAAGRHNLGLVLAFWRLQPEQALPHFEHVMNSAHPRRSESFLAAALSQLMLGRLDQAQASIAQARMLGGAVPMRQEGLIDLAAGDHAAVQGILERAGGVAARPSRVEFVLLRAALLLQQGRAEAALEQVEQRIAAFGDTAWSAPAVLLRVNALALRGRLDQLSESALREVLQREAARMAAPDLLADRSPELHLAILAVVAQRSGFDAVAREALVRLRPNLAARNQRAIPAMAASVECLLQPSHDRLACLDAIAPPHYSLTLAAAWQSAAALEGAEASAERRDRLLAARLQAYAEAPFLEWLLLNLMALQDAAG